MTTPRPVLPTQRSATTDPAVPRALGDQLAALLPPSPALDLATVGTGLADGPARESVARLLARR